MLTTVFDSVLFTLIIVFISILFNRLLAQTTVQAALAANRVLLRAEIADSVDTARFYGPARRIGQVGVQRGCGTALQWGCLSRCRVVAFAAGR